MSHNRHFWPLTALAALLLTPAVHAQTPPPVMEKDPVGYLHYLESSTDPAAVSVRQQIASGPADLARAREAATQAGIPLDAAALQKPLPPDDQNAAPLYQKLSQLLKDKPLGLPPYAQPLGTNYTYTPEQLAAVQKIYDSRQDVWSLIHQAADKPQCVFTRDWKLGPAILFPEYSTLREAARLLNTETYLLAAQGKYSDAVKNQARGFRIAEHAGSDPTLISYLVGVACDALALRGMQNVLTLAGPNADVDALAAQVVTDGRPRLSLRYALGGEAALQTVSYHWMHDGLPQADLTVLAQVLAASDSPTQKAVATPATPADRDVVMHLLDASEAETLDGLRQMVLASGLPPRPRQEVFGRYLTAPTGPPQVFSIFDAFLPAFAKTAEHATRRQANESITLAAADVLGAWTGDGTFPAALPHVITDPFTGRALGYRREGDEGFVVYSAGVDGTFGGGQPGDKTPSGQVLYRYPATAVPVPTNMLE